MSENRSTIKIRHGSGIPTTSNLTARELGFSDTTQNLYIHNGSGITRIGINALTGSVDPVAADGQNGDFYIKTETTGNETKITGVYSKVNGEWLEVQTGGGGGDASYEELTQAEYDLLTPAEKNNGTIYFITDTNGTGDNFQPVIFSSEEREIGVWTDGKPLYQRTYIFSNPVTLYRNTWTTISALDDIASVVDKVINGDGYFYVSTGGGYQPLAIQYSNGHIQAQIARYIESSSITQMTIRYTKSTDTAGSGTWTPQGVPAVHYSSEEKIAGVWVDGRTIYEITIDLQNQTVIGNTETYVNTPSNLNIEFIINIEAVMFLNNGADIRTLPFGMGGSYYLTVYGKNNQIVFRRGTADLTCDHIYCTIRYVKNT